MADPFQAGPSDETASESKRQLTEIQVVLNHAQRIASIGSFSWDFQTGRYWWSDMMYEITGLDPSSVTASYDVYMQRVHPEDHDKVRLSVEKMKKDGDCWPLEYRLITPSGVLKQIRRMGEVQKDADGKPRLYIGVIQDVTSQKRVEEELRRALERLREVQRVMLFGTWEWEAASGAFSWSRQTYGLFGLPEGHPAPDLNSLAAYLAPASHQRLCETFQSALQQGESFELEVEALRPDGDVRHMWIHGHPVRGADGKRFRLVGTALDITARLQAARSESAMARIESVGQLAAGIAHDFNNYLATLNLGFELVRSPQNMPLDEEFKVIKATLDAAKRLTNQLLTLAKGGRPVKSELQIEQLLRETADFVMRGTSVKCVWNLSPHLPCIQADADQVQQVISNILINARQAMGDQGKITIETSALKMEMGNDRLLDLGSYSVIGIEDEGPGILPEHIKRIFEPYFSTKPMGSGLGMAVAYRIMQSHGGAIWCESVPGKGTRFELYFPVLTPAVKKDPPKTVLTVQEPAIRCRVLVLDDEPFMLKCLGQYLRKLGYDVGEARIGEECLELYEKACGEGSPYDVLILDITIKGGMGGVETIGELKKRHPRVKAIASSGYSKQGVLSHFEEYGFAAALPKPYSVEKLREVLQEVLAVKED